jgi:hypothetical protein
MVWRIFKTERERIIGFWAEIRFSFLSSRLWFNFNWMSSLCRIYILLVLGFFLLKGLLKEFFVVEGVNGIISTACIFSRSGKSGS